jgi:teichoic acid transport system permease protein
MNIWVELFSNRRLMWKLAKNDFKKRYAGSYLGTLWAMMQPVVTVIMYHIAFGFLGITSGPTTTDGRVVPQVLFLTAGLVPWFYFSEAINSGTHALLEYSYLVKKVVFKISILPIIKIIGATFIHLFFVLVLLIVAILYGFYPTIYIIQLPYYSLCLFIFILALSYTTCSVIVFFRDLGQIINILLQIGVWATPILWNIRNVSGTIQIFLKLNPIVFIVNGYRNDIYERTWFFQDFYSTMYFWIVTVLLFLFGALTFKRLKLHFADVL